MKAQGIMTTIRDHVGTSFGCAGLGDSACGFKRNGGAAQYQSCS